MWLWIFNIDSFLLYKDIREGYLLRVNKLYGL